MKNEEIFGIINYVNSLFFSEFELETDDIKIRIKRDADSTAQEKAPVQTEQKQEEPTKQQENLPCVNAPVTGVFYRSPAPGDPAFVEIGDRVQKGDTLCILEAMKMMNEVKSEISGVVKEILISDGDSVDESDVLFVFQGE